MKTIIVLPFILVSSVLAQIPDFELENLDREYQSYSELKGDTLTLIDFWATWCAPCVKSIPEFKKIYEEFRDDGLAIIGINVDGPGNISKVKPFVNAYEIPYSILVDLNNDVVAEFGVTGFPTLIFVDDKDNILEIHTGFQSGDEVRIRELIREHLGDDGSMP